MDKFLFNQILKKDKINLIFYNIYEFVVKKKKILYKKKNLKN